VIAGKQVPTAELANLEHELKLQGAQAILLGCTELSVIAKQAPINQFIDPLRLIAEQILPQEEN
jgi:aspartate/glutamate racemase